MSPFAPNVNSMKSHQLVMTSNTMSEKSIDMNMKSPNWNMTSVLPASVSQKLKMSKSSMTSYSDKTKRLSLTASTPINYLTILANSSTG